ncbi:MAG: ribosomal-processing cysteine protease Prp [Firmicutes bacterium]|nr:ribosomal-processing cysteine protease Prp [Bacillota bacterium]
MIHVRVKRTGGHITGLQVKGHSGSAPKGEDIVCAGVSALVQTLYFSLQKLLQLELAAEIRDGYFDLDMPQDLPESVREKAALLAEGTLVGLVSMEKSYPEYLQVRDE